LAIEWQEFGGCQAGLPSLPGYGTSIIREVIPFELGGTVDLFVAPDGRRCRWKFPVTW
jgi:hypothetical protein